LKLQLKVTGMHVLIIAHDSRESLIWSRQSTHTHTPVERERGQGDR